MYRVFCHINQANTCTFGHRVTDKSWGTCALKTAVQVGANGTPAAGILS